MKMYRKQMLLGKILKQKGILIHHFRNIFHKYFCKSLLSKCALKFMEKRYFQPRFGINFGICFIHKTGRDTVPGVFNREKCLEKSDLKIAPQTQRSSFEQHSASLGDVFEARVRKGLKMWGGGGGTGWRGVSLGTHRGSQAGGLQKSGPRITWERLLHTGRTNHYCIYRYAIPPALLGWGEGRDTGAIRGRGGQQPFCVLFSRITIGIQIWTLR
jgi:hypothetical protein